MHKCVTETNDVLSVGFCSQITVGSQLPFRVPVVKGTIIEVLIRPGKAAFTVTNPTDGWDTRWENNHRVHTEYRYSNTSGVSARGLLGSVHQRDAWGPFCGKFHCQDWETLHGVLLRGTQ